MTDTLCIILNGAGTTGAELSGLQNYLKKEFPNWFIYYPHNMPGVFVGDYFPKTRISDFNRFINETIDMMKQPFKKVYLIGYSLGAATASIVASKTDKVNKMVLVAPIVKNPRFKKFFKGLATNLSHKENLTKVQRLFYREFLRRFSHVPKTHVWTLQRYFYYTKLVIKPTQAKILLVETLHDEMTNTKSLDWLSQKLGSEEIERYPVNSSHFLFFDRNIRKQVHHKIAMFLKEES